MGSSPFCCLQSHFIILHSCWCKMSIAVGLTLLLAAEAAATDPTFVGNGFCADMGHISGKGISIREYEHFVGWLSELYAKDLSKCDCPSCKDTCNKLVGCVGYDFSCCLADGERCIAQGRVLFSFNTRPAVEPEGPWSTVGYQGAPTKGPYFAGSGNVGSVYSYYPGISASFVPPKCYAKYVNMTAMKTSTAGVVV